MEHFPIVLALCRAAIAMPSPAVRKQVERLRDSLLKTGEQQQAAKLSDLLEGAQKLHEITPSRLVRSAAQVPGEELNADVPIPVDRETGAPLAGYVFPSEINAEAPVFSTDMANAILSLLDEWRNVDALTAVEVHPAKTCLIYGAPGTGKTCLALWMARQMEVPVVLARIDGLISSFLGTTARNISNLFTFANRYRCVLLLDEFDALAKLRDDPQEVGEIKRVVNALLQNLDTRRQIGLTIGVTNHPRLLDPAVWRRFEVQLEIPKPDFSVRKEIAKQNLRPLAAPDTHLKFLAWCTEGLSGAEIEELVRAHKRHTVVSARGEATLIDSVRRFTMLNSGRIDRTRKEILLKENPVIFRALKKDPELGLSNADMAELAGVNRSTVGRQVGAGD